MGRRGSRTGSAVFHFTASLFGLDIRFANPTPEEEIRLLRAEGNSLATVAERAGTTVGKVRRIVGKLDEAGQRRRQEGIASAIDAEPLTWGEKVAKWREQTGQSGTTFWRVLRRVKAKT